MNTILYIIGAGLLAAIEALPLVWVARLGRFGGWLAWKLDRRHRKVALANLTACSGAEKSADEIASIARENLMRIGEAFACGIKTASMSTEKLKSHVRYVNADRLRRAVDSAQRGDSVVAVGHFGNFELYTRIGDALPGLRVATTYRGLDQPGLDRLLHRLRRTSTRRLFFERRRDAAALKEAMSQGNITLGLLADQHGGDSGIILPFFGRECSTSAAPAIFALRYDSPLLTGFCYRTGLAQWEIIIGDVIPVRDAAGELRSKEQIMLDVNRAFEAAIRRDPANWFWVHRRWKPGVGRRPRASALTAP